MQGVKQVCLFENIAEDISDICLAVIKKQADLSEET